MFSPNALIKKLKSHDSLYWYSAGSLASSITGTLGGLLIIAWVPPKDLGIWKSALILQSYVAILQAGVVHGLNRELPFQVGKGKGTHKKLASTAQSFSVAVVSFLLLAAIITWFFPIGIKTKCALSTVFIVSGCDILINYLSVIFRAVQEFKKVAKINLIGAGVNLLTLIFVYYFRFFGILLRVTIIGLAQVALLFALCPLHVPIKFDKASFITLLKVGIPLYASGYAIQIALTFPNTILLFEEGTKAVGFFAPAVAAFGLMMMVPRSIGQYVYARMSFRLGETSIPSTLWPYAWKSSLGLLLISVPIIVVLTLLAPPLIERFYPKYIKSTNAIFWMLVAGTFMGSQMFSSALRSLKAWRGITIWTLLRVGLSFLLPYIFYRAYAQSPFVSLSIGYAAAGLLSFVLGLLITYQVTHDEHWLLSAGKFLSLVFGKK